MRLTKEREADIRDILDRDGNIGFHMTNDLLSEIDALRAELDEWKELHKRHVAMVIPGETDSADAYRKMYFQLRAALEEIAKYDAPAEDSVYTKVWMRLGKIAADALKR